MAEQRVYVPHSLLEQWSEQGKVQLDGNILTIPAEKKSFQLVDALRFLSTEVGEDTANLVKKVKTLQAVQELGAEVAGNSVILGETAYVVEVGFMATVEALKAARAQTGSRPTAPASAPAPAPACAAAPPAPAPAAPAPAQAKPQSEEDLLAKYLLENLS